MLVFEWEGFGLKSFWKDTSFSHICVCVCVCVCVEPAILHPNYILVAVFTLVYFICFLTTVILNTRLWRSLDCGACLPVVSLFELSWSVLRRELSGEFMMPSKSLLACMYSDFITFILIILNIYHIIDCFFPLRHCDEDCIVFWMLLILCFRPTTGGAAPAAPTLQPAKWATKTLVAAGWFLWVVSFNTMTRLIVLAPLWMEWGVYTIFFFEA